MNERNLKRRRGKVHLPNEEGGTLCGIPAVRMYDGRILPLPEWGRPPHEWWWTDLPASCLKCRRVLRNDLVAIAREA
jgi:hypothetical protein